MELKHFQYAAEIKAAEGNEGYFEGYGSVFGNVDSYNEVVDKGAFKECLKELMPALLWQHRMSEPIGVYLEAKEDEKGLWVRGQLNLDVQQGREAYALLKQGAFSGLSIGFYTLEDYYDEKTRVRHLKKVHLMEVSLVTFPANGKANVTGVKSHASVREFESFLREAGYSQEQAKMIGAHGFKTFQAHREGGDVGAALVKLEALTTTIRKSLQNGYGETL